MKKKGKRIKTQHVRKLPNQKTANKRGGKELENTQIKTTTVNIMAGGSSYYQ
jgi:hypothetical protein